MSYCGRNEILQVALNLTLQGSVGWSVPVKG